MNNVRQQGRESIHVWLAVLISVVFAAGALLLNLPEALDSLFRHRTNLPVAQWIMMAYVFWLLGLHWIAHREWRKEQRLRVPV